eukprot:1158714-Pelagomonas_calceolata.AAC.8
MLDMLNSIQHTHHRHAQFNMPMAQINTPVAQINMPQANSAAQTTPQPSLLCQSSMFYHTTTTARTRPAATPTTHLDGTGLETAVVAVLLPVFSHNNAHSYSARSLQAHPLHTLMALSWK